MTSASAPTSVFPEPSVGGERPPTAVETRLDDEMVDAGTIAIHAADLKRRALMLTGGNANRAEDLVQDTLERALTNLHRLLPRSNVRAWLYTIMVRRYRDILRHERVRQADPYVDSMAPAMEDAAPPPRWCALSTADIRQALSQLTAEQRTIFERREFGRQSYQRMADELGIPVATVGTRLLRVRERLRAVLMGQLESVDGDDE